MLLDYLSKYNEHTEAPTRYHQWCYMSAVASILGRNAWLEFGHSNIYPNMYIMLIGSPAARKSSAIKAGVSLLKELDIIPIAQGRTSKEKFLLDLSGHVDDTGTKHTAEWSAMNAAGKQGNAGTATMMQNLFDSDLSELEDDSAAHEVLIAADEFTNFVGAGNYEFISLLGELWDTPNNLPVRAKNSKSFDIKNPVVNILGGNTPAGFATAFPPEMIGQGFFSRLLMIYGERTSVRITWPDKPDAEITAALMLHLQEIRMRITGAITIDKQGEAYEALDWLYKNWPAIDDARFAHYSGRRFTHLLKLCVLFAADGLRTEIQIDDVVAANTLLTLTEFDMPRALGEFGRSRNSDASYKILEFLGDADAPQTLTAIWGHVHTDVDKITTMQDIVMGLQRAGKIQNVKGGFLPVKRVMRVDSRFFNAALIGE